ncbi:MAG TPA: TlpA disulfide reductase family protein [Archangium sp.]|nr:TlpA disulfide reductase family protein [Archangium sp.]
MPPSLRSRSLLACLLLMTGLACGTKRKPSEEYTQAYLAFGRLTATKSDLAYVDPEMTAIEELLQRVPPKSMDAEAAARLLARIAEERQRVQTEQEAMKSKVGDDLAGVSGLEVASTEEAPQAREPLAFTGPIETVEVDSLLERTRAGNKATLVFFYASSCSSCRKMFPTVNQVARNYREQGLEVVALSLDTDESELVRYLQRSLPVFTALRAAPHDPESLSRVVSDFGGTYPENIPYLALLDDKGKLVAQSPGKLNRSALAAHIEQVLH